MKKYRNYIVKPKDNSALLLVREGDQRVGSPSYETVAAPNEVKYDRKTQTVTAKGVIYKVHSDWSLSEVELTERYQLTADADTQSSLTAHAIFYHNNIWLNRANIVQGLDNNIADIQTWISREGEKPEWKAMLYVNLRLKADYERFQPEEGKEVIDAPQFVVIEVPFTDPLTAVVGIRRRGEMRYRIITRRLSCELARKIKYEMETKHKSEYSQDVIESLDVFAKDIEDGNYPEFNNE